MSCLQNLIYRRIRSVIVHLPEPFARLFEIKKEKSLLQFYSHKQAVKCNDSIPYVISLFDRKVNPGGLSDRLLGIVSVYDACKSSNRSYKIYHIVPFNLSDFLVPNKYDWGIIEKEINYDISSKILFIRSLIPYRNQKRQKRLIHLINKYRESQLHVYSNLDSFTPGTFSSLFNELFKPSVLLQTQINQHLSAIGCKYVSATFRFQQLLGDFKEGNFDILSPEDRLQLIERCLESIKELINTNKGSKILVTSDSTTFLKVACEIPNVYVIPGTIVHMAFINDAAKESYLKSFVDLYMIAHADKVYSIKIGKMYDSGFPKIASKIFDKPFELISK